MPNFCRLYLSIFLSTFQASVCLSQVADKSNDNVKVIPTKSQRISKPQNPNGIVRVTSNDNPNPPASKASQGSPRKGARYRLIFLRSAINSYKKRVAAGSENPDVSSIESDLRLVQEEAKRVDVQRDPNIHKEIQTVVSEAEAILKRHSMPQH